MPRLFVAIPLSFSFREKVGVLLSELRGIEGLRAVSEENLHVTLAFLGEISAEKVSVVRDELEKVASECSPFPVMVRGVSAFPDSSFPRVVWAGLESSSLLDLMRRVKSALTHFGVDEGDATAHLTLARVKKLGDEGGSALGAFLKNHRNDSFGEFKADRFILYESELKREGPLYRVVKEFVLC